MNTIRDSVPNLVGVGTSNPVLTRPVTNPLVPPMEWTTTSWWWMINAVGEYNESNNVKAAVGTIQW